jgi:hypothetical protein
MNIRLIIGFLFAFSFQSVLGQPNFVINSSGSANIVNISFSNSTIEYEFDTSIYYDSPIKRKKKNLIAKNNDTIRNLNLATTYYFRARFINNQGVATSNWTNGVSYRTADHPFYKENNFAYNGEYYIMKKPFYEFYSPFDVYTDYWIDTTENFNSANLVKYSTSNLQRTIKIKLIENRKFYYIRSRVVDGPKSLNWKTIKVYSDFKPIIYSNFQSCNDTSITWSLNYNNFYYNVSSFSNKSYVVYGNQKDSFTVNNYTHLFNTNKNLDLKIYSISKVVFEASTKTYYDTTIFKNLLVEKPLNYSFVENNGLSIQLSGLRCNVTMELELYKDSTLTTLINKQIKSYDKSNISVIFNTDWDYFLNNTLRYRYTIYGVVSQWFYVENKNIRQHLYISPNVVNDTNFSFWTAQKNLFFKNKTAEIEVDVDNRFNSPKLKKLYQNDSSIILANCIFGKENYVRCRVTDGIKYTPWSNIIKKNFSNLLNGTMSYYGHSLRFNTSQRQYEGVEVQFGPNTNNLKHSFIGSSTIDTFKFKHGDTIFYRARRYTKIDTSDWSSIKKYKYVINDQDCVDPIITYNGNSINKDTFNIFWLEKKTLNPYGYYLYFSKNPNDIDGIIEIDKSQNRYLINKKNFPSSWFFTLSSVCKQSNTIPPFNSKWYPLNSYQQLGIESKDKLELEFFYSQGYQSIVNNSDIKWNIIVFDNFGRTMSSGIIEAKFPYDLKTLSPGVYYANFTQNNIVKHLKFIVQ